MILNISVKVDGDKIFIGDDYIIEINNDDPFYTVYKNDVELFHPDTLEKCIKFCIEGKTKCEHLNVSYNIYDDPFYCHDCGSFLRNMEQK